MTGKLLVPPWETLSKRRCQLGLTQLECGEGVVSQSTMSLIERGLVFPPREVIVRLAERLGDNPDEWVLRWETVRTRTEQYNELWEHFSMGDSQAVQRVFAVLRTELPVFEQLFYDAYLNAVEGQVAAGHSLLLQAWAAAFEVDHRAEPNRLGKSQWRRRRGFDLQDESFKHVCPVMDHPSNQEARGRCLVLDAHTQMWLARYLNRTWVAAFWEKAAKERFGAVQAALRA